MLIDGLTHIWNGTDIKIFYQLTKDDVFLYANYALMESFNYQSKAGTCSYCGHDITPGQECPGCAARKSSGEKLIAGKAEIGIYGFLPTSIWLFHNPYRLEAHIQSFGRRDNYDNWEHRIVMSNLTILEQSMSGFEQDEPTVARIKFSCDVLIEEHPPYLKKIEVNLLDKPGFMTDAEADEIFPTRS